MRVVLGIAAAAALAAGGCGGPSAAEEKRAVLDDAQQTFERELDEGRDMSEGPCIADPLPANEDWVVVVVREPRDADRDAAERCSAFADGRADHVVELDEFGHVIRAQ
jgi:hypothetical protein